MIKKWKEWHTLLGWLVEQRITVDEVKWAVIRYIRDRDQDPQLELPLRRA